MNYRPPIEGSFYIYKMNDITKGETLIYRRLYKPAQSKYKWYLIWTETELILRNEEFYFFDVKWKRFCRINGERVPPLLF